MPVFIPYAKEVYHRCDHLANFSQAPDRLDRQYLTKEHALTNETVSTWMKQAGMRSWFDEAGNVWGRYESQVTNAKSFIMGSHLDSVPDAGKYDGILGVLGPIALIQYFHDKQITFPFHIDIVGFSDEEGSRFGTTLLGSRAITGSWKESWAILKDVHGTDLATAMRNFGLDINKIHNAQLDPDKIRGFLELHIEQGPVLEAKSLSLGYVTAIAGAKRFTLTVNGESGHAGTVPMDMRKDALVTASKMIVAIDEIARSYDVVATVGRIENKPNAVNVISGECQFSLDLRSQKDQLRDQVLSEITESLQGIARISKITLSIKQTHHADAVNCDSQLTSQLASALSSCGMSPFGIASGAGHDAMEMAKLCPSGMLFMRCKRGISHHPDEDVEVTDICDALEVLNAFFTQQQ